MSRSHRLLFLLLSLLTLIVVGRVQTGSFSFLFSDFWFSSGLLLLILLSVVDQPHFSKDANIFVNGVTGLIALVAVRPDGRDWLWHAFFVWSVYLAASSYVLMLRRARALTDEPMWIRGVSRLNREIGRPEALFSAFFLWGVFAQYGPESSAFRALLIFWAAFTILNLPAVARSASEWIATPTRPKNTSLGQIIHFISPSTAECSLDPGVALISAGTLINITTVEGVIAAKAAVVEDRVLDGSRFARVAITSTTEDWPRVAGKGGAYVRLDDGPSEAERSQVVGVVGKGTAIDHLEVLVEPRVTLQEGHVLRVALADGHAAYYQVVGAKVVQQELEAGGSVQHVSVIAGQLGSWEPARSRFEPVAWVPPPGGLVTRVGEGEARESRIPPRGVIVGRIPNAPFSIHVDTTEAVTHNTAIVGVTGSGKTYLALLLIEALLRNGVRVLILDVSRQHWACLREHDPVPIRSTGDLEKWLSGAQALAIHQYADATSYPKRTADFVAAVLNHLDGVVTLKPGENEPARICVVMEEAHSLIPEWNQVAEKDDGSHVNRTARAILQGRKYGLGCLIITQRTANVTKTILNQCNTMFALQSFDQTGLDFLRNYMGEAYAQTISTLPIRHAILVGKASSSMRPVLFSVGDYRPGLGTVATGEPAAAIDPDALGGESAE